MTPETLERLEERLQSVIAEFEADTGARLRLAVMVDGGDSFMAARIVTHTEEEAIPGLDAGVAAAMLSGLIIELVGDTGGLPSAAAHGLFALLTTTTGIARQS